MLPALFTGALGACVILCLNAKLLGQCMQHRHRYVQRVIQEGAQVAHRPKLQGESKPVVLAALLRDQCVVGIVQVELAG